MSGELPARFKGSFLEDSVGDIFKGYGFDVTKRIKLKDRYEVEHEIDVLATKKEDYGTVTTAIECKYHNAQIGIEVVRDFHEKLLSLGLTKGIIVSVGGFSADAMSQAKVLSMELWDLTTLQDKLGKMQPEALNRVDEALPVSEAVQNYIYPSHIRNNDKLALAADAALTFQPYYFIEYHCFSQDRVGGGLVNLESGGVVAVSGQNGQVHDSMTSVGVPPALPKPGWLMECANLEPKTIYPSDFTPSGLKIKPQISVIRPSIRETEAKTIAHTEIAKNLSQPFRYRVGNSSRQKVVRPRKSDIEITRSRLAFVPFLSIKLASNESSYNRLLQASTLKYVRDETALCRICSKNPAILLCETCGRTSCSDHSKQCLVCGKNLCDLHVIGKGLLFRKYYCGEHSPK